MGPDEYHMNVNNNVYTNFMTKKTFNFTLEALEQMKNEAPELLAKLTDKLALDEKEYQDWRLKAEKMRIPMNTELELYEQHDGYFDLPEVDVKNIPESQIPIYKNWAYLKIFRYNMIKQPDVLLLPLFYSQEHSIKAKKNNYEYYESRCIHESSLSPGVHSILAAELGKDQEAYSFFQYMARLDLDNRNKNTGQGLHITSMSGVWLNMVSGFGGLRTDGETLIFNPSIPKKWKSFTFKLRVANALMEIKVDQQCAQYKILQGGDLEIKVFNERYRIDTTGIKVPLKSLSELHA
jgi:maltose phosphorylase